MGEPAAGSPRGSAGALGIDPTPDDGARLADGEPWDESSRPHHTAASTATYSDQGRAAGRHLIDVHDMLRGELTELRRVLAEVRDGALSAGEARQSLNAMTLRQNDWALGAFCSRYCNAVARHHGLEDDAIFPHLARSEPQLGPVLERLGSEHLVIGEAIEAVDVALVQQINQPGDLGSLQRAIDLLTDALLSHLSYEERELVEPLARHGFYPGQL